MKLARHLPNFITCCNLLCGCVGIALAFQGKLEASAALIWGGAVFDFLDGFTARLLRQYSELGKQLDSLADMVTFSLLPSVIMFNLIQAASLSESLPYLAFILAVFSALRLAKFNIDERQTNTFFGLPTPASALFVSAYPFFQGHDAGLPFMLLNPIALVAIVILLSWLMVSDIEMFSLKFKNFKFRENALRYYLLIASIILIVVLKFAAVPIIIILYVFLSISFKQNKTD